ncbi:peptide synthetase [Alcanivorax sp. NBRC 101098]|uniref:non-ribosomal peptide synthetase n=1 Tax=Alcanivorax sp. NBRC 101098 TaxID=1113728 RepID=UPI0004ABE975|nr:non-ribosomal peptide synthetase [Alcanivorax sp. NBRC 101098]BAP14991.1 peptide synthetase [Alcanivorax sp. NBRC 101098]
MSLDKAALARRFMALDETKQAVFLQKLGEKGIPFERLPIVAGNRPGRIPLAPAQQRLWTIHQLEPANTAYHLSAAFELNGPLDVPRLLRAMDAVVRRHESLRTRFVEEDGEGYQRIVADTLTVEQRDARALDDGDRQTLADEHASRLFVLGSDSPLRVQLLQLSEQCWRLQLVMHHLVSDGWSMDVFFADLARAYLSDSPLPALAIQYADYALWQKAWLDAGERDRQLSYWREQLGHDQQERAQPPLLIAHDRAPAQTALRSAASVQWSVPAHLQGPLQALARDNDTTLFTVVLAAWQWALASVSGRRDIPVGVPVANRERAEVDALVGFFVNTLVLRGKPRAAFTVNQWVTQLHQTMLDAQAHQALPFDQLVAFLAPQREPGETPLFQVLFNYQRRDTKARNLSDNVTIVPLAQGVPHALFDLGLDAHEGEGGALLLTLTYAADRFHSETVERLKQAMNQVLTAFSQGQHTLGSISVAESDVSRLQEWGQGEGEWQATSFVSLFSQQAAERGDAIALVHGGTRVSFAELDARSNQLARYLMGQGVKADQVVGVSFERGVTMVEAFIAVMKAGGAFLPLDPGYPKDRLHYMLKDSGARLLLTSSALIGVLPEVATVAPVAVDRLSLNDFPANALNNEPHPDQLAYVIYTSGSTGKPKGVSLTHAGLSMHVQTIGKRYGMTPDDVELQFASISFDGAVERWTVPLAFGSRVVIRDQQLWSAQQTCDALQKEGVTIACIPPSYMGPLLDWIEQEKPPLNVRSWTLGGEAFTRETFERMQQVLKPQRILNGYGPTETVVTPMLWAAYEGDTLSSAYAPIGHAVGPRKLYVLDQDLNRVPVGVAGELYIGNEVGLARGYHQRPDLTAERFLPDPFGEPGERMYRTGDLVKYRDDGVMEYLGRVDQQVKIRGFRIELGEIESQLLGHEQIREAVVVAQPSPTGDRLVGYIVMRNAAHSVPGEHEPQTILAALSESLPDYMVPSQLITLEAMPLTPAGKVDRKALPVAQWHTASEGAPPQTDNEKVLADIWQSLLGRKGVSRDDNFFALGGDSILALQVVSRARQQGLALTPKDLFEHPRLHDLAACAVNAEASIISQQPLQGELGLLPIQQHFFSLRPPSPSHWNQHLWLALDAPMDRQALNVTLQALYRQHDALRLQFTYEANGWRQTCLSADRPCDELLWWCQAADEAAVETLCEQTQQSLNIETGELFRVLYVQTPQQPDRMLLVIHHLAVDGVSWRILLDDLLNAYGQALTGAAITLPERSHNLSDWHQALEQWLQSKGEARLPFWQGQQPEKIDSALPTFAEKESVALSLGKDDTRRLLQDAPVKLGVSVPALLLTALTRTLKPSAMGASLAVRSAPEVGSESPSQDNQLVINLEGHGRETRLAPGLDLSRTLGWFTSLFPLRLPFDGDPRRNLFAVSQQLANTEADGGVGYGALRYLADSPLNDSTDAPVTFNYLGQYHNDALIQGFTPLSGGGKAQAEDNPMAAPLAINGQVVAGKLGLVWDFARSHYPRQQVQHLCSRYRQELLVLLDLADSPQEARADPALVTVLNSSADTPVLWCPHPVTGRTTGYQALAASLEGQWQVRGLQSRSFLESGWFDPSLSEMVERYYRTVRQAQPEGPYYLLGWSMGGAMSMELAHRLEQAGEEVAFVGLLDTYVPGHEVPEDQWSSPQAQQTLRAHLGMLLTCAPATALDDCMARLRDSKPAQWPQNFTQWLATQSIEAAVADSAAQLLHAWAVEQHLRDLCWGYQLPALHTPVHSWWASEPAGRAQALQRGLALCAELAHTETVSADHLTIVREPSLLQGLSVLLKCCKGGNALMDIPD